MKTVSKTFCLSFREFQGELCSKRSSMWFCMPYLLFSQKILVEIIIMIMLKDFFNKTITIIQIIANQEDQLTKIKNVHFRSLMGTSHLWRVGGRISGCLLSILHIDCSLVIWLIE